PRHETEGGSDERQHERGHGGAQPSGEGARADVLVDVHTRRDDDEAGECPARPDHSDAENAPPTQGASPALEILLRPQPATEIATPQMRTDAARAKTSKETDAA